MTEFTEEICGFGKTVDCKTSWAFFFLHFQDKHTNVESLVSHWGAAADSGTSSL